MNGNEVSLIMAASVLLITATLMLAPSLSPAGVVLGARVPRAHLADLPVVSAMWKFRAIVGSAGVLLAALVAVEPENPLVLTLAPVVELGVFFAAYVSQHRRIVAAKAEGNWFDGLDTRVSARVSDNRREKPDTIFLLVAILTSLGTTVMGALYLTARWGDIPAEFATHYGPGFQPDSWDQKSVASVFAITFFNLVILVLMWATAWPMMTGRVARRSDRTSSGEYRTKVSLAVAAAGTLALSVVVSVGLTALQIATILPEFGGLVKPILIGFLVTVLGTTAAFVLWSVRVRSSLERDFAGEGDAESPDNDDFYKWGMFYYNPDDPAVLVEKRHGFGVDFNYATWQGKLFVGITTALVAGSIVLAYAA